MLKAAGFTNVESAAATGFNSSAETRGVPMKAREPGT